MISDSMEVDKYKKLTDYHLKDIGIKRFFDDWNKVKENFDK